MVPVAGGLVPVVGSGAAGASPSPKFFLFSLGAGAWHPVLERAPAQFEGNLLSLC